MGTATRKHMLENVRSMSRGLDVADAIRRGLHQDRESVQDVV